MFSSCKYYDYKSFKMIHQLFFGDRYKIPNIWTKNILKPWDIIHSQHPYRILKKNFISIEYCSRTKTVLTKTLWFWKFLLVRKCLGKNLRKKLFGSYIRETRKTPCHLINAFELKNEFAALDCFSQHRKFLVAHCIWYPIQFKCSRNETLYWFSFKNLQTSCAI